MKCGGQNDGGSDDRTEERAPAHLVQAGNAQRAAAPRGFFQRETANRSPRHGFKYRKRSPRLEDRGFPLLAQKRGKDRDPSFSGELRH